MKKRIPIGILIGIAMSLIFPFLPRKHGRQPLIETWEYSHAVLYIAVIVAIFYPISYAMGKEKIEKEIRELKLSKHLLEKEKKELKH